MALKVRKAKAITPFQHAESGFCRKPSLYQLMSMMHGMSDKKRDQYARIAKSEVERRDLMLKNIPSHFHRTLFPWWTNDVLKAHRENGGISEFSWVFSADKDRLGLMQFMNDEFLVALINTTWEFHEFTKLPVGKDINENLVYLPNINHMNQSEIVNVAQILTKYCEFLEEKSSSSGKRMISKKED